MYLKIVPFTYALLVVLFFTEACKAKTNRRTGNVSEMNFEVNDSLLINGINDSLHHLKIKFPNHYLAFHINEIKEKQLNKIGINLLFSAKYENGRSIFTLSDLHNLNDSLHQVYIGQLDKQLEMKNFWIRSSCDSFYANDVLFRQYYFQNDSTISFKIILPNKNIGGYQLDFVIPVVEYKLQAHYVESVLGSVTKIN